MSERIDIPSYPAQPLHFGAEGCDHCREFEPVIRSVSERHPRVPAFVIDCGSQGKAADAFGIAATPTTVLVSHGRQVTRLEGVQGAAVVEMLFQKAEALGKM